MIFWLKIGRKNFTEDINFYRDEIRSAIVEKSNRSSYKILVVGSGGEVVLKKKRRWLSHFYEVVFSTNEVYKIESFGGFKINFVFHFNTVDYYLYVHKGLLVSIYLNHSQVGYIRKENKSINSVVSYEIIVNDDVDQWIIYSLALVLYDSSISVFDESSDVEIDFGNMGPEEFPFDFNWKPSSV